MSWHYLWTRLCISCQHTIITRHVRESLGQFTQPEYVFRHVHIELIGPWPVTNSFSYILTYIDHFTRWSEVIPTVVISAKRVTRAFVSNWVARFGVWSLVTTDHGRQLEAFLYRELSRILWAHHSHTDGHRYLSNGMAERFHSQLKDAFRISSETQSWLECLLVVLLGCRTEIKSELNYSSAELLYHTTLIHFGTMLAPTKSSCFDPASDISMLNSHIADFPLMSSRNQALSSYVAKYINDWTQVFVRDDSVCRPLDTP